MIYLLLFAAMFQQINSQATIVIDAKWLDSSYLVWQFCPPADYKFKGCVKWDGPKLITSEWPPFDINSQELLLSMLNVRAQPIDVPAIQHKIRYPWTMTNGNNGPECQRTDTLKPIDCSEIYGKVAWTCKDKSRILLTAEDGKHWCHKVSP